ncbi:hypothetical protein [Tumebacillus permanentifrigoris]|uniref:Uncharacterized protein n=1 Tax=Tumebacillus permanentifrigoris TaxID=378543 RepID=A0A316DDY2_9BACL|nr:hypothetical protein [Tumebacillus permanentifrigoris]PWK13867.1 hypothetical protein C7459_106147 [Tumebacillus permanentifrigoris]
MEEHEKQEQEQTCQTESCCGSDCSCNCNIEVEHLEDGYRVTIRGDKEKVEKHRRVADAYVNFLNEQKKAHTWLPLPLRWLLRWFNCCK